MLVDTLPEARPDRRVDSDTGALNAKDPNIRMIDLNGGICDDAWCYGLVGNVIVYRDTNHLTWQYAETLAPRMWREFSNAIKP